MASDDIGDMHLEETREERPEKESRGRKIRVTERISPEFLFIVEQLLAQHVIELQDVETELEQVRQEVPEQAAVERPSEKSGRSLHFRQTEGFGLLPKEEPSRFSEQSSKNYESSKRASRESQRSTKSVKSVKSIKSDRRTADSGTSLNSKRSLARSTRSARSEQILRKHNEMMTNLDAAEIMMVLDDNEEELREVFQEKSVIDREAVPGEPGQLHFSETASVLELRYRSLTRFQKLQYWLRSHQYEMVIFIVLYLNVLWMALELHTVGLYGWQSLSTETTLSQKDMDNWAQVFDIGDLCFAVLFMCDVVLRISILQCGFWKSWLNYVDVLVSVLAMIEATIISNATTPVNPMLFRFLRIGKLVRAVRMVTMTSAMSSLQLLVKCLASSRDMLICSFSILTFVQCVAGVIVATLCADFIQDETKDPQIRQEVFMYYGTFSRTFLAMFEIMFANWGPPCRVLVENVSEWFSIFFLIYRCVLGFAVLNVMNAVFVQQTMRTAVMDEDLAFRQRQKEIEQYTKKVKTLFLGLDSSGDGTINLEEFSKLVKSDKLAFWMSQLELEYHDLLQLFEFLDNGDGQITLTEFIDGAARLRGGAKAIDVWRMETKLEVLFEEVLAALSDQKRTSVQAVLRKSSFQFIHSNADHHIRAATDPRSKAARDSLIYPEDPEDDGREMEQFRIGRDPN